MPAPSPVSFDRNPHRSKPQSKPQQDVAGNWEAFDTAWLNAETDPQATSFDSPIDARSAHEQWERPRATALEDHLARKPADSFFKDPRAEDKVREIHAALASMDRLPMADQTVAVRYEQLLRDQPLLEHRVQARLKALGLSQDVFTRVVQDPKSIGWTNRAKEFAKSVLDRSYRTIDSLAEEYRKMSRDLHEAKQRWESLAQRESPAQKKQRMAEKAAVRDLYSKEEAVASNLRSTLEQGLTVPGVDAVAFSGSVHSKIVTSAERVARGAKKYPSAVPSAEYKVLENSHYAVEQQIDQIRVASQRALQQVCFDQHEAATLRDVASADALRKQAIDLIREQQPLYESVQELNDRLFLERMQRDVIPFHPVFKTLFQVFATDRDTFESADLIRQSQLFSGLSKEDRVLVERYINVSQAQARLIAHRYEYHRGAAWLRQKETWIEEGLLMEDTPANRKQLDADQVHVHGMLNKAYPNGRTYKYGSSLEQALLHEAKVPVDELQIESALASFEIVERRLPVDASLEEVRLVRDRAVEVMKRIVAADGSLAFENLIDELQPRLRALEERVMTLAKEQFAAEIKTVESEIIREMKRKLVQVRTWMEGGPAYELEQKLTNAVQTYVEEAATDRLAQVEPGHWKRSVERAMEQMAEQTIAAHCLDYFERQFVEPQGGDSRNFILPEEFAAISRVLKTQPAEATVYLSVLGQYIKAYSTYRRAKKISLKTKELLSGLHLQVTGANRDVGLPIIANTRPTYWADPALAGAETEFPDVKKGFVENFQGIEEGLVDELYAGLEESIGVQGIAELSPADKKGLITMFKLLLHPDRVQELANDPAKLEQRYLQGIKKLPFMAKLSKKAKDRLLLTINLMIQ